MEKLMRKAPIAAVLVALIIQVERVTEFGGRLNAGPLAMVFAIFLGGVIFVLSYWSERARYEVTAQPEDKARYSQQMRMKRLHDEVGRSVWGRLVISMLIDGGLNLAETWLALPEKAEAVLRAGALAYGIFPTLAALGLGRLQSSLDRLPTAPTKKTTLAGLFDAILRKLETRVEQGEAQGKQAEQVAPVAPQALPASEEGLAQVAPATPASSDKGLRKLPLQDAELLVIWEQDPQASDSKVAQVAGVSRQAIQQRRERLQASGAIRKTDQGIQIVAVSLADAMADVRKEQA